MTNNTNTTINAAVLFSTSREHRFDENFKASVERLAKLAAITIRRDNWQTLIDNDAFAGVFSNPEKSLEVEENNQELLNKALKSFRKGLIWINSQCKQSTGYAFVNTYIGLEKDQLVDLACAFLSSEIDINKGFENLAASFAAM